jgi:hypothetical protein
VPQQFHSRTGICPKGLDRETSLALLLEVVGEFEKFGGASVELAAWEVDVSEASVARSVSDAIDRGLLRDNGLDGQSGERMWQLSELGQRGLELASGTGSH